MAKKKSVKRTAVDVPKSLEEVTEFIGEIGKNQRKIDQIQIRANNQIERVKSQAIKNSLPFQEEIDRLFEGVYIFAERHRDTLTEEGKKKTAVFPTGEVSWRMTPPAVSLRDVERVKKLCKSLGLERFIRIKEEVDKKAMLKEPDVAAKIEGVTISQKEEFVVKPAETEIEIPKDMRKLQKVLPKGAG